MDVHSSPCQFFPAAGASRLLNCRVILTGEHGHHQIHFQSWAPRAAPGQGRWCSLASVSDCPQVTKIFQKKKNSVTYNFRQSFSLYGMQVLLFENQCKSVRGPFLSRVVCMCAGHLSTHGCDLSHNSKFIVKKHSSFHFLSFLPVPSRTEAQGSFSNAHW